MPESLHERVVTAIGDQYELDGEIGRGGMAVVYRARDRRLNRPVAIKVLPPELAHDQAIRVRFTREAQTSAQLSHPHIVPIFDVGEREGIAYFVMGLVSGWNLAALLMREPKQPVEEVRRILGEVADALAYAHLRGVIHRDIKPDNILLDRQTGRAMVTDFGIAWAMEAGARLTATGIAVGTPTYMSPEQAVGERALDGRSDIYSAGVVGYQMLTGRVPFEAGNAMALLLKHVTERPRAIADLRSDAPRALREAIERAMMKAPEDRWPTAAALRDALATDDVSAPAWRADLREPVRYPTPRPESRSEASRRIFRRSPIPGLDVQVALRGGDEASPGVIPSGARGAGGVEESSSSRKRARPAEIIFEPPHLASLTPEQREDLRLWHGRVNLRERIRAMRGYAWTTLAAAIASMGALAGVGDVPPLILAPVIPIYMSMKTWRRAKSLREAGLRIRRVLLMPREKWVIPAPAPAPGEAQLLKLAPREVIESPEGAAIRRAVEERAAILEIFGSLSKPDRARLPDLKQTVDALVDRVANLAQSVHRLDGSFDPALSQELDQRIADVEREGSSPDAERRLGLLRRQRATLDGLVQHRAALVHQIDSVVLALGNLRLDLIKLRSSGLQSALEDVSTATQEARALSRDIDAVLAAASEVKGL